MSIDERLIDEITNVSDIVEVVGSRIPLTKAGANFRARCPFHQEKTPSFMVSPAKQIFHCFGCGAGGNVYGFLMKYEHMSFPEAVRYLGEKAGIRVPEYSGITQAEVSKARIIQDIFEKACEYYEALYRHPQIGKDARAYLEAKRSFSQEVNTEFRIGYAQAAWDGLLMHLRKNGVSDEDSLASGLVLKSPKGSIYDFFRNRIMFPITNVKDKVIGFGARSLGKDEPKYINSPETEYFHKRFELYGLDKARRVFHTLANTVIIVEGYLDVMRLHEAGLANTVAPLGTALTNDQVKKLGRYVEKAIIVFDGDAAGLQAGMRAVDIVIEEEVAAEVLVLPEGIDPDTFIATRGKDAFVAALDKARDAFDFKLDVLLKQYDPKSTHGLVKISKVMTETIKKVQSTILRDQYVRKLASRLGISEQAMRDELRKEGMFGKDKKTATGKAAPGGMKKKYDEELALLYYLINDVRFSAIAIEVLDVVDFEHEGAREVFALIKENVQKTGEVPSFNVLTNHIETEMGQHALTAIGFINDDPDDSKSEAFAKRLKEMKLKNCERKLKEIHGFIVDAEAQKDDEAIVHYQQMKINVQREKKELLTKGISV